jgi:predicted DCC family thiol-disulfide oxidoreductase YuxK
MAQINLPPGKSALLLYDGECPLCQRSVAILKKLDWFKKIEYQNCRLVDQLPQTDPPLVPQRLLEEMHLVPRKGRPIYHGFGAFRWMAWRMPLLWLIAPFLYLPGVPWLGNRVYLWVARNRFKLVPCQDNACAITPKSSTELTVGSRQ